MIHNISNPVNKKKHIESRQSLRYVNNIYQATASHRKPKLNTNLKIDF